MAFAKKKKDVLFLCQFFYPEYVSSATLPWDTAKALTKAGFSVDALCGYPKEYCNDKKVPRKEKKEDIEIKRLKYLEVSRIGTLGRLLNFFSFTLCCFSQIFKFRHYRSVIVYSNPPILPLVSVLAKKLFGTKLVYVCYDVYPEIAEVTGSVSENGSISKVMNFINRHLYKNADYVVALAQEMKEFLEKNRGIDPEKVVVIPNWYADEEEKEPAIPQTPVLKEIKSQGDYLVSYLGNMGTCQDMETIVGAVLSCTNEKIKFLFAGHGNKVSQIKEQIKGKAEVFFFDFLKGEDFRYVLEQSDCFVVSLAEGLSGLCAPSKTYSYMSQGKPIIGIMEEDTDIGRDLKEGNAGYVCKNGESEKLLQYVKELEENREMSQEKGRCCRQIFLEKYTEAICTKQYSALFERLLRK